MRLRVSAEAPAVLDASAVLAYLEREPGLAAVRNALASGSVISSVNLAEVYGRISVKGRDAAAIVGRLKAIGLGVEPFVEGDAAVTGSLLAATREFGLSLADRACLALARRLGSRVLTADRAWSNVDAGVEVEVLR